MKTRKSGKLTALILTVLLICTLFAGCKPAAVPPVEQTPAPAEDENSNEEKDPSAEEPAAEGTYSGYNGLPETLPDSEIELLLWPGNTGVACESAIIEFNEKYPNVTCTLNLMAATSRDENLQPRIAAGNIPAIMTMAKSQLGDDMFKAGWLRDISDTRAYRNVKPYFQEAVISYETKTAYNVPVADGRMIVYANMDLLKEAGITEWPVGWDNFIAMCDTLKEAGITPIVFPGAHGSSITHALTSGIVALRIWKNSPDDFDRIIAKDTTYAYNSEVTVKALEDIQYLADNYFNDGFMGMDANDAMTTLCNGGAAMFIQGTWYSGQILDNTEYDIQVQMLPFADDGSVNVYQSNTEDGWAVNAKLDDVSMESALAMFDFFNLEGYHHVQHLRKFISVMADPVAVQGEQQLYPTTQALIESSTDANSMPHVTVGWNSAIASGLNEQISAMLSGQATAQQAADGWQKYVEEMR